MNSVIPPVTVLDGGIRRCRGHLSQVSLTFVVFGHMRQLEAEEGAWFATILLDNTSLGFCDIGQVPLGLVMPVQGALLATGSLAHIAIELLGVDLGCYISTLVLLNLVTRELPEADVGFAVAGFELAGIIEPLKLVVVGLIDAVLLLHFGSYGLALSRSDIEVPTDHLKESIVTAKAAVGKKAFPEPWTAGCHTIILVGGLHRPEEERECSLHCDEQQTNRRDDTG